MEFRELVRRPLLLANVWDVASLRIAEKMGIAAVATSSGAIAWSLGLADGSDDGELMLARAAEICAAARVPVTVDIERGYRSDNDVAVQCIKRVLDMGGVGVNLEDATAGVLHSMSDQCSLIERADAVRQAASDFVLNARCDLALTGLELTSETIGDFSERIDAYVAAGADQVFLPGVSPCPELRKLCQQHRGVINAMVWNGGPQPGDYFALGVTRVSMGTAPAEAALAAVAASYKSFGRGLEKLGDVNYGTLNALM